MQSTKGHLQSRKALPGVLMVLLSAFLFASKAVFAKMIYRQVPLRVIELLYLRMLFALPFYLFMLWWQMHKQRRLPRQDNKPLWPLPLKQTLVVAAVGCLGYYISSFFDFWGLKYVSAGLERIILFSYPTLVVLMGWLFFKNPVKPVQYVALAISYAGIAIAFADDVFQQKSDNVLPGAGLIFCCAFSFAWYVLLSGRLVARIGVGLFTSVGMLAATLAVFIHYAVQGFSFFAWYHVPSNVLVIAACMALFATVVPSFLVSEGIRRIGSSNVAIISAVGPVITIAQAAYFLDEPFSWLQGLGTVLVVVGVYFVSRQAARSANEGYSGIHSDVKVA